MGNEGGVGVGGGEGVSLGAKFLKEISPIDVGDDDVAEDDHPNDADGLPPREPIIIFDRS